jgi:hypothetical protein
MHRSRLALLLALAAALLAAPAAAPSGSADMVISQVYAGGGNSGATYTNDFVELFNRGSAAVDVSGWSIQYASAAGTSWQATALAGTVPPGGYLLVQLASGGANGAPLPTADATGTTNLANTGGKVALVRSTSALSCGGTAGSCSAVSSVADLLGYGSSASDYEGSGPASGLSNTTAAVRAGAGCTDTDANASDFASSAPTPRSSATPASACGGEPEPPPSTGVSGIAGVEIDIQSALSIALERPSINFGNVFSGSTPAPISERVTVSSNIAAGYALTVHRSAFQPSDLPLGMTASAPAGGQLGAQLGGGAMTAIPIAPAADLLVGTTSGPSSAAGDAWQTNVGFTAPLPVVPPGKYTATITFTAIGR